MKITNLGNGKIAVDTPYNPAFVGRIKKAGARWDAAKKVWTLDERSIDAVRAIMRETYGQDDMPQELVTVRVTIGEKSISEWHGPVVMFGKTVASAFGRDSGARIGQGVCFEVGSCNSSGSVKNWYTTVDEKSIITLYDVPRQAVEKEIGWGQDWGTYEIIEAADPFASLRAERKALLKRLTEIDEILGIPPLPGPEVRGPLNQDPDFAP